MLGRVTAAIGVVVLAPVAAPALQLAERQRLVRPAMDVVGGVVPVRAAVGLLDDVGSAVVGVGMTAIVVAKALAWWHDVHAIVGWWSSSIGSQRATA